VCYLNRSLVKDSFLRTEILQIIHTRNVCVFKVVLLPFLSVHLSNSREDDPLLRTCFGLLYVFIFWRKDFKLLNVLNLSLQWLAGRRRSLWSGSCVPSD